MQSVSLCDRVTVSAMRSEGDIRIGCNLPYIPCDGRNIAYKAVRALLGSDAEGLCPPEEGVEGKFLVDLKETNRRRLLQLGLAPEHIDVSPDCTMCMQDVYWSHRATKGRRGTMASVIML